MARLRKPPYRCKNLADISYTDPVIANFVPNFVVMATREVRDKLNNNVRLAIPENHTLEPKITTLTYTQANL